MEIKFHLLAINAKIKLDHWNKQKISKTTKRVSNFYQN